MRRTLLFPNQYAVAVERARAARERRVGWALLTIERLAARLAGGFAEAVSEEELLKALPGALNQDLGELEAIKGLGGFQRAAAGTLRKVWSAGLSLEARGKANPRCAELARLEAALLRLLPPAMRRPGDLVAAALARSEYAARLFGSIDVHGCTELEPVWRPLLLGLAELIPVTWHAGPRPVPGWVAQSALRVTQEAACEPSVQVESCADPRHEALEALRWARELLVSGRARPEEIAIGAACPQTWDPYFAALEASSGLDICHVHGRSVLLNQEGQLVAALAEALLAGVSKARIQRLVSLLRRCVPAFADIPSGWWRGLPEDAPLLSLARWRQALDALPFPEGGEEAVREIVETAALGLSSARAVGERLLRGQSLALWRQALLLGPPEALDVTLESLRAPDEHPAETSIVWGPAGALASAPRPYVRLLGLTARAWPRQAGEDPLLPGHIVPIEELDSFPVQRADRIDFETIVATTARELVCSRARRDAEGRANGISPLYPRAQAERYLRRSRLPRHAACVSDRLFARAEEFAQTLAARSALSCWNDWHRAEVTAHDGLLRADHPVVLGALTRLQSASSLAMLLRDPLGYLWTYGFGWKAPEEAEEPLFLDALTFGTFLHAALEAVVTCLERERAGGFAAAGEREIHEAIDACLHALAAQWEAQRPIPPPVLWKCALDELRALARSALTFAEDALAEQRSWAEVPFGGVGQARELSEEMRAQLPWDPDAQVSIPGTDIQIAGVIDRLDLGESGAVARVTDYKAGKTPPYPPVVKQGAELQRCLYAYAVKTLLPKVETVHTRLLYPRALAAGDEALFALENAELVLEGLTGFLVEAKSLLAGGNAIPGPGGDYRLACALPAGAEDWYRPLKAPAVSERLGSLPQLWEMK